jgi:hypothetical protein
MVVSGLPGFFTPNGVEVEENVDGAKPQRTRQHRPQAKQGPPSEAVACHKKNTPGENKSYGGIKGTNISFHDRFGFDTMIPPPRLSCRAFFAQSSSDFNSAGGMAKNDRLHYFYSTSGQLSPGVSGVTITDRLIGWLTGLGSRLRGCVSRTLL